MSFQEADWLAESTGGVKDVRGFFSAIGFTLPGTGTANAAVRCFANRTAHKSDDKHVSCSVSLVSGEWNCRGCGERGNAYRAAQLAGYEDKSAARMARQFGLFLEVVKGERPKVSLPNERQLKQWRERLRQSPQILARLEELKGWTSQAMLRLGLGWDGERITFPVRTAKLERAGVVRYLPGGDPKVRAVPGTKRNLFPPPEVIARQHPLFLCEGEGDAVAVWSCGLKASAVPGAGSWRPEWAPRLMGHRVVVLADCDGPGRLLAARVAADVPGARVVDLDPTRTDGHDIGDWVREASHGGGLAQMRCVLERLAA